MAGAAERGSEQPSGEKQPAVTTAEGCQDKNYAGIAWSPAPKSVAVVTV